MREQEDRMVRRQTHTTHIYTNTDRSVALGWVADSVFLHLCVCVVPTRSWSVVSVVWASRCSS